MGFSIEVKKRISRIVNRSSQENGGRHSNGNGNSKQNFEAARYITLGEGDRKIMRASMEYIAELNNDPRILKLRPSDGHFWRPRLVSGIAQSYKIPGSSMMDLCAVVEAIHSATLAMDDLPSQDGSDIRRRRPSSHRYFQMAFMKRDGYEEEEALNAGVAVTDLGFSTVTAIFDRAVLRWSGTDSQKRRILDEFQGTKINLAEGQSDDLWNRENLENLDAFANFYRNKTGALFRFAAVAPGIAGKAGPRAIDNLKAFGDNLGIAYQLADDVIDRYAHLTDTGKPEGQDGGTRNIFDVAELREVEEARAFYLNRAKSNLGKVRGKRFPAVKRMIGQMERAYEEVLKNSRP